MRALACPAATGMRSKRKETAGGPTITFDTKARKAYLTGFRKRKKERRKQGMRQIMETERQEKITLKWEHREDVKCQWKEVQWAEKKVEKLLGIKDAAAQSEKGLPRLKNRRKAALQDDDAGGNAIADGSVEGEAPRPRPLTVNFEVEDDDDEDDPFGGCEVTTTVGAVGSGAAGSDATGGEPTGTLALSRSGGAGSKSGNPSLALALNELRERCVALKAVCENDEERKARRAESLRKEELKRQHSLSKKVVKRMEEEKKKKKKKKGTSQKRKDKKKKTGAHARRKRKQK